MLRNIGYQRVRPLQGGLDAWIAAGGETEVLMLDGNPSSTS
jgi:3-mercaptopyruvate sulfurtransferase SseA